MTLERLLKIDKHTGERVIQEIRPGFYTALWPIHNKSRFKKLLTQKVLKATAHILRADLEDELQIRSLDDIDAPHIPDGAYTVFGFKYGKVDRLKQKLIDYGVFPTRLEDYRKNSIEKICRNIIDRLYSKWTSAYFSDQFVKPRALESNRKTFAQSKAFKKYLKEEGIHSLDDISKPYACGGIPLILGYRKNNPTEFKQKLIEYRVFPTRLADYTKSSIEQICRNIIDRLSSRWTSVYFSDQFVRPRALESNRKIFAQSRAFRNYLKEKGVHCLDDVSRSLGRGGMSSILGFTPGCTDKYRQKLIHYGVFPTRLKDYNGRSIEQICRNIVKRLSSIWTSVYFSEKFVRPRALESNRKIFAQSRAFRNYLKENNALSLDDISELHARCGLGSILGADESNPNNFRRILIDYGVFPTDLQEYDPGVIEKICKKAIDSSSTAAFSCYFSNTFVKSRKMLESNRKIFAQSRAFRNYLKENNALSLDDISDLHARWGLGSILGADQSNPTKFRRKLIDYGVFSTDLQEYDPSAIEKICKKAVDRSSTSAVSCYFSNTFVKSEEVLESNRKKFMESKVFLDYLLENDIDLNDLGTVQGKAKTMFRKILGIDVDSTLAQSELESLLKRRKKAKPDSRIIATEWGVRDEVYLRKIARTHGPSEDDILAYLDTNIKQIEEELGRTLFACKMKMADMGLISELIHYGPDTRRKVGIIYPFPRIHEQEEPKVIAQFPNYAKMLKSGLELSVIPVYTYESVATSEDGSPQFLHATVPISYRGFSLLKYKNFERIVLATVQQYIADPDSFVPEKNYLKGSPSDSGKINILALQKEQDVLYTQIFLRSRFSINPKNISTHAIKLENGSEIYFFKHPQEKVTFELTRR